MYLREAGWGAIPILLFGITALVAATLSVCRPHVRTLAVALGGGSLTLLFGILGAVTGIQASVAAVAHRHEEQIPLFLVGLRESLNNVVLATGIASLALVCAMVGLLRLLKK